MNSNKNNNIAVDKSIINLNNILIDELRLCIKEFTKYFYNRNMNSKIYLRFLFHKSNIFNKLMKSMEGLLNMMLSINIMDDNYKEHIELIILLDYIKRLIYERKEKHNCKMIIPSKLPQCLDDKRYSSLDNYGLCYGIVNLLERSGWIIIYNDDDMYFYLTDDFTENPTENIGYLESLGKLLQKLSEVYNSISKVETLLVQLFSLDELKLAELLKRRNQMM